MADGPQARAIEVLGTQVDRFETLLADLLEISRYDAGRVTLETEPTNLVMLTQTVVEGLQPLSSSLIEVRPLGGYGAVDVDARRIRRIVSNLVGNAIEHGEGKPIVVTIDSNASAIAIAVRDWGVGLRPEDVDRVFDRFWRADPSRKRTLGGTGLGLAIAREDAAVHGGLLEAWSRLGEGSQFRLTLPRGDQIAAFVSPIPLVPDDVTPDEGDPEATGGWLRRPWRNVTKGKK
jgi:two-component system sensor histidine kinase MtrB